MKSIIQALWKRSPAENFAIAQARLTPRNDMPESRNDMLDPLMALSSFPVIAGWCLAKLPVTDIMLLGDARTIESWQIDKILTDKNICIRNWTWTDGLDTDYSGRIVICRAPYSPEHWDTIWKANKTAVHAVRVTTIGELLAPFLQVVALTKCFDYFVKSIDDIIPWYLGKSFFGPLKELDAIFPLAGKTVIEFGCLDGYQSLGLCHLKARLTCLDARAENVIKTRAALNAVGFDAPIFVDDFHNAHANKYGRFDLAFAHGVYYHSVAPFVSAGSSDTSDPAPRVDLGTASSAWGRKVLRPIRLCQSTGTPGVSSVNSAISTIESTAESTKRQMAISAVK